MCSKLISFLFITFVFESSLGFINVYPKCKELPIEGDPGNPLFLTPLIEEGKISEARDAAKVGALEGAEGIDSYSGFLTVNKKHDSNIFFWFFPSTVNYKTAPVVLWLQGGPGATSLIGLFTENGPFSVGIDDKLKPREYSWSKSHSMIFIDNPVGTGYSFTNSDSGYSRNETSVGRNLYTALIQFFELFPELQENEFYITGESYAESKNVLRRLVEEKVQEHRQDITKPNIHLSALDILHRLHIEGISGKKDNHQELELEMITYSYLYREYSENVWLHVYTDGSVTPRQGNAGAGEHSREFEHSVPAGRNGRPSNYDGQVKAIDRALEKMEKYQNRKVVIL